MKLVSEPDTPVLRIERLRHAYRRGAPVLDGVSLRVERGQVVGLLGKNGAGKTTLLRIVMGMMAPDAGQVQVLGMDPRACPVEVKRRIGYVAEEQILPPYLTVAEALALHRSLFPTWDEPLASELRLRFELPSWTVVRTLSRGQARRLALLCAVAHRPDLLILDEPAGGLDPVAHREFLEISIRLINESGSSIVFSSHVMTDVERLADRIVILHERRILIDETLSELREGYSLALLPGEIAVGPERLQQVPGLVSARWREDGCHALLRFPPDQACAVLERELGGVRALCPPVVLEDLFIEAVEGRRS
jgi:ABC-2 type transport system ATP-binding protein